MSKSAVLGLSVLLLALCLAAVQLAAYRSDLRNAGEFVGAFPQNMDAINQLLERTSYKLFIVDDYCAYGFFSNPSGFDRYRALLLDLRTKKNVSIEMHVYDAQTLASTLASQLGLQDPKTAPSVFASLKTSPRFVQYFDYKRQHNDPKQIPPDYTQFLAFLASEHGQCVSDLQRSGLDIRTDVSTPLPLFMWVRDDSEEAIFSIYNLGHDSREISQRTSNKQIVLLLKDIGGKTLQEHQ